MSVDDRLRAAFGEQDESWDALSGTALREVSRRHTRGLRVRRAAVAGALVAAVTVGAVVVTRDGLGGESAPDPVGPPSPPAQAERTPSAKSALEGRWRSALLDEQDLRAALEAAGGSAFADQVLPSLRPVPFRLVWVVTYETAALSLVSAGESVVLDQTTVAVAVDGDRVTVAPRFADGATVHRFVVDGDELRLTFVSTSEPDSDGVPGEVWQRLLYDAFPLTRR